MSTPVSLAVARAAHLDNARLGVVHFLSTLQVNAPEDTVGDLRGKIAALGEGKIVKRADQVLELAGRGEKAIDAIADTVRKWLAERFGISPADAAVVVAHLRNELPALVTNLGQALAKDAASKVTLGGLGEIASRLYEGIDQTITYYNLTETSRSVKLESGHPALVADAITKHVWRSALIGLGEAAKKGALLVLAGVTAGASLIVEKLADVIEALLRFAVRFYEALMLSRVFASAKQHWQRKDEAGALHKDAAAFQDWFKPAISKAPIVASLVMNCGVAGDAMAFLQVCTDGAGKAGAPISQGEFDSGVTYLNKLKASAASFIRGYQKNITISSEYAVYKGLLRHAAEIDVVQKEAGSGWRTHLFKWANSDGKVGKAAGWALRKAGQQSTVHAVVRKA